MRGIYFNFFTPSPSRGEGREGVISFGCGYAALCPLWLNFLTGHKMRKEEKYETAKTISVF